MENDTAFSDTADKTKTLGFAADDSLAMDHALDHATLDLYTSATTAEATPAPTEAAWLTELIFQEAIRFNNPLVLRRHDNETVTGTAWFRAIGPWQAGTGSVTATDNVAVILGAEGVPASFRSAGQNAFSSIVVSGPTQLFLDAGATSIGALTIDDSTEVFVGDGDSENGAATLTLTGGIAEDGDTLSATVNADGTLVMGANGAFWPKDRTLTVVGGGTVTTTPSTAVALTFEPPTPQSTTLAIAPIPALAINDGAILRAADTASSLSIDALKGFGEVFFTGAVSIGTLHLERGQEMTLDRAANDTVAGSTTLGQVSGEGGTLLFGLLGDNGTTGVQAVCDALTAGGFQGTVGFLPTDYPVVDFAQTAVTELPCTLAVQPGQTLVIRLDQYVDADIVWPEAPATATLRLVEAGPFGGEASLPVWPANVTMEFVRYGDATTPYTPIPETDFTTDANDDGVTVDLSWQNPVLTGKVAWVDIEFNGTSLNTGWATLTGPNGETGSPDRHNGMLRGDDNSDEVFTSGYADVWNPDGRGAELDRRPYISVKSIDYPEEWTLVTRLRMPEYSEMSVLTIGANYVDTTGGSGADYSGYAVLALATGALQDRGTHVGHLDDNASDVLNLWFFPKNTCSADWKPLTSVSVPNLTDSFHLLTIRYDHGRVALFMDEHQVLDVMLPAGTRIGPGLQFGSLMGGANVDASLKGKFSWMDDEVATEPGTIDFLRLYDGLLPDSAISGLAAAYPYVHKERGTTYVRDVRYVRREGRGTDWVSEKAWVRQTTSDGNWTPYMSSVEAAPGAWDSYLYNEPAEGSIVLVECDGATTLSVNTTRHGVFPSENRTYAQLIVTGSGTLTLEPCEGWETTLTDDGEYRYGRLVFSGGQGDKAAQHEGASDEENGGGTDAAYFYADANIRASVCDLSRDGVSLKDNNTVAIYADEGLMRGEEDALHAVKHLTGPVSGSGTFATSTSVNTKYGQQSDYVLVDYFDPDDATWLISDVTVANNGPITESPRMDTGLFAEFTKIPGILYLELAQDALDGAEGSLSEQKWHRFGYNGDDASVTASGLVPEPALPQDFARADGLYIRLKEGTHDTLRVDSAGAVTLPFLVVEAPLDDRAAEESLAILPSTGGDRQITFSKAIATARPLTVYDATSAGNTGADGIGMMPREVTLPDTTGGTVTFIQGGTRLYGEGPYRAGKTTFAYDLDGSTIATLESLGELIFSAEQSLPKTDLVATPGASIVQAGADAPFAVKSLTLQGEGSTFRFNSTAVDVAESLLLATDAVLDCTQLTEGAPSVRDVVTDDETDANIDVLLPGNAQDGLIFLQSEEPDFNWIARARLLASSTANLQITRWDVRLDHEGIDGTNYRIATPNLDVPNFDDRPEGIPEEDRPGEGENEWPEGSEDEIVEDIIIDGHIAGEAEGYTMANTQWLTASDIANAYACFGSVWTYARRNNDRASEDYATIDLLMAYEFGISRMAFTQDGNHIVIEATLRNALKDCPYFTEEQLQGVDAYKPSYQPGVTLTLVGANGPLTGVTEITGEEAKAYGFSPDVPATEVARWFLVPYDEANFPAGQATPLTVEARPPAEQSVPATAE